VTRRARRRLGLAVAGLGLAAVVIASVLVACVVPLGDGKRRIVAGELTAEIIVPTYDEVVERTAALAAASRAFVANPAADTLAALQAAWRAARVPWKQTDAFRFGPLAMQSLGIAIDQVPVDPVKIDAELAGTATLDAAYIAGLGANKKGFHTIEYFIFGADDAAVLVSLTTDSLAPRRIAYLAACTDELAATAVKLRDAWVGYAAQIADPGADNMDFPTIKASIDALVNETVFQAEVVADARIGKPMGTATGGTPQPELQESGPSNNSVADMTETLVGIRNIYFGTRTGEPGKGIGGLVAAASPATDRDVRAAFENAFAAIAAIPKPYTQALVDQRPEVMTAYTAVQDLQHVLATEVIATLGATLKFNDNDGD
jgi:predicted lipoprotein